MNEFKTDEWETGHMCPKCKDKTWFIVAWDKTTCGNCHKEITAIHYRRVYRKLPILFGLFKKYKFIGFETSEELENVKDNNGTR